MSNIDKRALREAAEKASTDNHTQDEWFHYLRCSTPETVLALLDELEKMQAQSSKWCEAFHKAVSVGARYEERIAELEAREVVLPSTQDVHPLGPQSAKIFCEFHRSIVNRCADEIRKVGVKVSIKGN
ncbi:ead/Ea22-like family protein [Enterobacter kobei]|uniref:ead/Ea22-like family protein n=1 Tax=Enterobacter kobei TaxID=208224 RepID=UPI0028750E32|nr:ead/Ea22-like family protein [Enterobacter kobei]MDS0026023.1 ead/Ea22-like family protein [Enterobacter kobei]